MRATTFGWKSFLILLVFSAVVFFTGALAEKMGGILDGIENNLPGAWQKIMGFISEKLIFKVGAAGCRPEFVNTPVKVLPKEGGPFVRGP